MGCIYQSHMAYEDEGDCQLFEPGIENPGVDEDGNCRCSEDPDPSYLCESYESDYKCDECGTDLNNEECDCEDN